MPTLSASLVNHGVASVGDVEEALARQVVYGGDLITNLLELAGVTEAQLTPLLAKNYELEPAPVGELPTAEEKTRRLVPGDLALRHALYPLKEEKGVLEIAVSEPLAPEVEQDLSFALGVGVVQRVAPLVRIRQAIARDYQLPLDRRLLRLIAKLSGNPDPSPSSMPEALRGAPAPAIPPPPALPETTPNVKTKVRSPSAALGLRFLVRAAPREKRRHLGPYTAAMAEQDLLEAETRDQALRAFFDYCQQYFEYSALFVVHGDLAEGREAHGPGASPTKVRGIGVPLDLPSALSRARGQHSFQLVRLSSGGLDGAFVKDLGRKAGPVVTLLPINVRERCVLILYGDHGDQDVELENIGDVIAFAPLMEAALERIILQMKLREDGAGRKVVVPARATRKQHRPAPSREDRALALAQVLESAPKATEPPPLVESLKPQQTVAIEHGKSNERRVEKEHESHQGPAHAVGLGRAAPRRTPTPVGFAPPVPPSEPRPNSGEAAEGEAPVDGSLGDRRSEPLVFDLTRAKSQEIPAATEVVPDEAGPTLDVSSEEDPGDEDWVRSDEAPLAPASRSVAYSARPLKPRHAEGELGLPSVIVDVESDCRELVRRVLEGDEEGEKKLVELGEPAVAVLIGVFPGPITREPRRMAGTPVRASECGPVLRVLAQIGARAGTFVIVRTADTDPNVRAWATRLLGELPSPEAAKAVARRAADLDAEVRTAARDAGRLMQSDPDSRMAIRDALAELVFETKLPAEHRLAALEHLTDLRDGRAVPRLIRRLEEPNPRIAQAVLQALIELTRQDFGKNPQAWYAWWESHAAQHRIEWLIDALMHESGPMRRAAGDELKALTKEYFGYYDDLPRKERARAQQRYREWWESIGKARFTD